MIDLRRCQVDGCGAIRPADRIVLHVRVAHPDVWWQTFGPRPPALQVTR